MTTRNVVLICIVVGIGAALLGAGALYLFSPEPEVAVPAAAPVQPRAAATRPAPVATPCGQFDVRCQREQKRQQALQQVAQATPVPLPKPEVSATRRSGKIDLTAVSDFAGGLVGGVFFRILMALFYCVITPAVPWGVGAGWTFPTLLLRPVRAIRDTIPAIITPGTTAAEWKTFGWALFGLLFVASILVDFLLLPAIVLGLVLTYFAKP